MLASESKKIAKTLQKLYIYNSKKLYKKILYAFRVIDNENRKKVSDILTKSLVISNNLNSPKSSDLSFVKRQLQKASELDYYEVGYLYNYYNEMIDRLMNFRVPTINNLYKELRALEKEFCEVKPDTYNIISVTTENIVLEGVEFGKFDMILPECIFFRTKREPDLIACAVPQTPNYAYDEDEYPHPHICGTAICLGNGKEIAINALTYGRIYDYFCIVNSVLNTYGKQLGPHVEISAWTGAPCYDCGESLDGDEICCTSCDRSFCEGCLSFCESCELYYCFSCVSKLTRCQCCSNDLCNECVTSCECCDNHTCTNCIAGQCKCYCNICESCSEENVCNNCGCFLCQRCDKSCCEWCNIEICKDCVINCEECNCDCCDHCTTQCTKCKKIHCDDCIKACKED